MIYRLPLRLRQALALAILSCLVFAVAQLTIVPALSGLAQRRADLAQEREQIGRLKGALARGSAAEAPGAGNPAQSELFVRGESSPIRIAALQTLVNGIFEANGIKPRSMRTSPAREQNGLNLLSLEASFVTDLSTLQRVLLAFESHRPILLIESLQVSQATALDLAEVRSPDQLEVRLGALAAESKGDGS